MERQATTLAKVAMFSILLASSASAQPATSLKVMTFNVWSGESNAAGRNKIAQIIQAADADVIGIQELDASALAPIAAALGFNFRQQSGGDIQVFSRFPITTNSTSGYGVRIEPFPGQQMWLFNAHLAAYPYQPYDLRDGVLPMNESAVIAAANSARGAQLTSYLNDMTTALSSRIPVFFTGDFNEPSHLDWTSEAAVATPRPFDLAVNYPASSRIVSRGMSDSFREVRPDEVADPAYTWTPGYPPPTLDSNEVHDRIDIIYHSGVGVSPTGAWTVGFNANDGMTDIAVAGYNADHRAVVVEYQIPPCSIFADLNLDCQINVQDWMQFRSGQLANMSGLSANDAYLLGDLNGDYRNDYRDFQIFRGEFSLLNGDGSFERMLAQIPEPAGGSIVLVALGWLVSGFRSYSRSSQS